MGKTAFSGPVFGAKQTLFSIRVNDISSGTGSGLSSVILGSWVVPVGEDWYATEFQGHRNSSGSTGLNVVLADDGTPFSTLAFNSSVAGQMINSTITPTAGEYDGRLIASGSTVTISAVQSSALGPSSGVTVSLFGYRRWVPSSKVAE